MMILTDDDVCAASAAMVVAAAREALLQAGRGELTAPPRARAELGSVDYVFTVGGLSDGTSGFRAYRAGHPAGDQMVAVWNASGQLTGLVVGDELGARRTGALGAVAVDLLARPEADTAGVVGTGRQAWAQLWALTAVRELRQVRVYSPDQQHRRDFAARAREELGLMVWPSEDAASAVCDAGIVILATRSTTPVIDVTDIAVGAHVTTVGPKFADRHEMPSGLVAAAALVTCDSPAQAAAYPEPFFTGSTPLVSLADVLLGTSKGRRHSDDITVHCSVGLAGSEVLLAQRLLTQKRDEDGPLTSTPR